MTAPLRLQGASKPTGLRRELLAFARRWPIHLALGVLAVIWILPSLGVIVTSFRPRNDTASATPSIPGISMIPNPASANACATFAQPIRSAPRGRAIAASTRAR